MPQFYDPRKQRKAFIQKHLTIEKTPVKYFDQALAEINVNINEEVANREIEDIDTTSEEEPSMADSEPIRQREDARRYLRN